MTFRKEYLPFTLPDIDESELQEIGEALASGWVTTGPKVRRFESEFAQMVGANHAIAVNSCTAAMHLALEAVGVQRGDEVITTPYTFAATAEVIRYFDAKPVFVDIDPRTLNINPLLIEPAITLRTRAILPVHLGGLPVDLDPVREIARSHRLPVIEDAAHTFPAAYKGKPIGCISEMTCFSFYATKPITTGEGGMITTDNDMWADRCRIMSLHGISKDAWNRYAAEGNWYYEIVAPGFKYNMTDVAAAMGIAQLHKAYAMRDKRRAIAMRFNAAFENIEEVELAPDCPHVEHAWHLYVLRLHLERLKINRAAFIDELKKRKICSSVHFIPLHIHPYYRDLFHFKPDDFPVAYRECQREISLPIYSRMSDDDVQSVIDAVLDIAHENRKVGTTINEIEAWQLTL
jgi:dTDP-4-amino-4,6-dideoxygalactose transaminase